MDLDGFGSFDNWLDNRRQHKGEIKMTPQHIELFVDRLCAYFPTEMVNRANLKHTWTKDRVLREAPESIGGVVLELLQKYDRFPNLGEIKTLFNKELSKVIDGKCDICDGTGFVYADEDFSRGVQRCKCFTITR